MRRCQQLDDQLFAVDIDIAAWISFLNLSPAISHPLVYCITPASTPRVLLLLPSLVATVRACFRRLSLLKRQLVQRCAVDVPVQRHTTF